MQEHDKKFGSVSFTLPSKYYDLKRIIVTTVINKTTMMVQINEIFIFRHKLWRELYDNHGLDSETIIQNPIRISKSFNEWISSLQSVIWYNKWQISSLFQFELRY